MNASIRVFILGVLSLSFFAAPSALGDGTDYVYEFAPEVVGSSAAGADALSNVWARIAKEQSPAARVVYRGRRPFIELNGKLMDPLVNIGRMGDPYNESAVVRCAKAGIKIVQLNFVADTFYRGDGVPCDFSSMDRAVGRLLQLVPDAYVIVSLRFTMHDWAAAHPDEQVGYATGAADPSASDELRYRVLRPSSASARFRALALRIIGELGAHVGSQPWGKRMIGFRPCYGIYTEWHCFAMYEAPDTGLRMQEKFCAYMKAKRGVDGAKVPSLAMRRHENADPKKVNLNGDLLDPAEDQLVLDYYDCLANSMADLLLDMAREAKRSMPGRLVGAYYGYVFSTHPPEGANALLDKVLASPDIDFLSDPPNYSSSTRRAGGGYLRRTIPATFRRHRKLTLMEDDSRFHHVRDWLKSNNDGLGLCTASPRETEMNMRRNWLNQFFDGGGLQLNDPITSSGKRPHAFDDPAVFKAIADSRSALEKAGEPAQKSGNRLAVVFSPREALRRDGGKGSFFTWNLYQTSLAFLYRAGVSFDFLSLEDYLANPGGYRTVLFLNAFYLSDSERAALVRLTRRPGMTAVWVGPAGGVTDNGFDDAAMSALTGVSAKGAARRPNIVCTDAGAGVFTAKNIRFHLKTLAGGARSIIVPDAPPSLEDYVAVLREAGAWFYAEPGSYFRRHGSVFMFHTGTPGSHTIRLPRDVSRVRELFTGREFTSSVFTLETDGPSTWLFKAEPPNP